MIKSSLMSIYTRLIRNVFWVSAGKPVFRNTKPLLLKTFIKPMLLYIMGRTDLRALPNSIFMKEVKSDGFDLSR